MDTLRMDIALSFATEVSCRNVTVPTKCLNINRSCTNCKNGWIKMYKNEYKWIYIQPGFCNVNCIIEGIRFGHNHHDKKNTYEISQHTDETDQRFWPIPPIKRAADEQRVEIVCSRKSDDRALKVCSKILEGPYSRTKVRNSTGNKMYRIP